MARKQQARPSGFVLFDVVYEDGTQTSNRKVPAVELCGLNGDGPARSIIESQDHEISEMSGQRRARIKSISRTRHAVKRLLLRARVLAKLVAAVPKRLLLHHFRHCGRALLARCFRRGDVHCQD